MQQPTVYVVDDDESVCRAICRVLTAHQHQAVSFYSAETFLSRVNLNSGPACLVLDLSLPAMDGKTLQQTVRDRLPVIVLTGQTDVMTAVGAMAAGAIDFLLKPVFDQQLLLAVERASKIAVRQFEDRRELEALLAKVRLLTRREREVMELISEGWRNKEVAFELGTVEKTIKVHRANLMRKLEVNSLPALVRAADKLKEIAQA